MGLGLSISQAIVQAHGGRIRAEESPEGGARFAIELPGFEPLVKTALTKPLERRYAREG